jgi:NAD(P)-dependent dehydrogenase (short-subunit alcohol dehydrogenase family)
MRLSGKNIIVTGGNGLLGRAIVNDLRNNAANVIIIEINVETDESMGIYNCDITDEFELGNIISQISNRYNGKIDGLVNNAYPRTLDWGNKFEDVSIESWKTNVEMQLNSCFSITKKILKIMKNNLSGSIVNVASIYGVVGNDFTIYENTDGMTSPAAYSAIKGGIINFTKYLASYFGPHGIRVNAVSPGGIFNNQNETFVKQFEYKVPLKRMAKPEEIAPSITFLLTDESSYITGHNLIVDGGWTSI